MNTPLHCLLLQTPGELLEGEKDFLRLGYAVEAFPSMQDASCLDDAEPEELPLCLSSTDACRSPLAEGRFGASDAVPLVEATTLRDALEKELNAHPETHLLRFFHSLSAQSSFSRITGRWNLSALFRVPVPQEM